MSTDDVKIKLANLETKLFIVTEQIKEMADAVNNVEANVNKILGSHKSPLAALLLGCLFTLIGILYNNILKDTQNNFTSIVSNQNDDRKQFADLYGQFALLDKRILLLEDDAEDRFRAGK